MNTRSYNRPEGGRQVGPQAKGNRSALWWGLLVALLILGVYRPRSLQAQGRFTVVLDAGHGGKDPGAVGNGVREKEVTLDVVLRLGKLIKANHPEVRVLYTRERDVFVGLQARADFANRHKASLFMSVHVNSASSSTRGTETYVLGLAKQESNLAVAMRENDALLLEDNYKTTYKGFNPRESESYIIFDLMQEAYTKRSIDMATHIERQYRRDGRHSRGVRQAGFWVLAQSAMPSILTEIGFLSNAQEARYLGSQQGREEIARGLSRAFSAFYRESRGERGSAPSPRERQEEAEKVDALAHQEDGEDVSIGQIQSHEPAPSQASKAKGRDVKPSDRKSATQAKRGLTYRVQFLTSPDKIDTTDRRFAKFGKPIRREKVGRVYAYTVGEATSLSEARKMLERVRKHERDAFIVSYQGGKRVGRVR